MNRFQCASVSALAAVIVAGVVSGAEPRAGQATGGTGPLVIANANLLDGTGAPPRSAVDIFVDGDRITAIAPTGTRPRPAGATVIDAGGKWVIPGLIDSHVHYEPWMGEMFLHHGVTTVVDLGNATKQIVETREATRAGTLPGPRLLVAGLAIQGPSPEGPTRAGTPRQAVKSVEEARARAQELLDAGVDVIKVHEWVPAAWIREITTLAHAKNRSVVAHLSTPVTEAIDAGLDGLIHPYTVDLSTLSDPKKLEYINTNMPKYAARVEYYPYHLLEPDRYAPLIQKMVRAGTFFNPTFGGQFRGIYPERTEFDRLDHEFILKHAVELGSSLEAVQKKLLPFFSRVRFYDVDADLRKKLEAGMEHVAELMRQFVKAGGRMVAGTDTSSIGLPGIRLHRELQLWTARGIPAMHALQGATQFSAQLYRRPDLGVVAAGKAADLVILEDNPLEDMRRLGGIVAVIKDGRRISRELHAAPLAPLASAPPGR